MSRKFRYHAAPEDVRKYIESIGYETQESYNRDRSRATGFTVMDTTIDLSYDLIVRHSATGDLVTAGYGLITFWEGLFDSGGDAETLERSRKLYEKLYRRFRRR